MSQASGDGMIVKDKGNRERRKLGRKAKDLKRKISVSGVPLMKMRRGKMLKYLKDNEDVKVGPW